MSKAYYQLVNGHAALITWNGKELVLDGEESSEYVHYDSMVNDSPYELARLFPEAVTVIRSQIKMMKQKRNELRERGKEIRNVIEREVRLYGVQETLKELYLGIYVDIPMKEIEERLMRYEKMEYLIKTKDDIDIRKQQTDNIRRAKEIPIDTMLTFKNDVTKCIWHDEKTPSLKYYKKTNTVHCFAGCGSHDSIDVTRKLNDCSFYKAIQILLKK